MSRFQMSELVDIPQQWAIAENNNTKSKSLEWSTERAFLRVKVLHRFDFLRLPIYNNRPFHCFPCERQTYRSLLIVLPLAMHAGPWPFVTNHTVAKIARCLSSSRNEGLLVPRTLNIVMDYNYISVLPLSHLEVRMTDTRNRRPLPHWMKDVPMAAAMASNPALESTRICISAALPWLLGLVGSVVSLASPLSRSVARVTYGFQAVWPWTSLNIRL